MLSGLECVAFCVECVLFTIVECVLFTDVEHIRMPSGLSASHSVGFGFRVSGLGLRVQGLGDGLGLGASHSVGFGFRG